MTCNKWYTMYVPFAWSWVDIDVWLELGLNVIATDINKEYIDTIKTRLTII